MLEALASRAVLLDLEQDGEPLYVLPPPMAGFFEFSMMRVRGDVDQKRLAELYFEYLNVEEDFIKDLFVRGETQLGRTFVQERAVPAELSLQVLDYERASHVIREASTVAVSLCYCRHKMEHVGRACDAPRDICLTFGGTARSLAKHGYAREASAAEGLELLHQAQERGLVQFGENVRERPAFICNCCGCCCEAMLAARRFGFLHPVHTTNFVVALDRAACDGCGKCVKACPVGALRLEPGGDPAHPGRKRAAAETDLCLGCGVCVPGVPEGRGHARGAEGARHHPRQLGAPDRGDGDRARPAARPRLRQPGPPQPPGDGRDPGRDPEAAPGEAGARQPPAALALPRPAAGSDDGRALAGAGRRGGRVGFARP